VLCGSSKKRQHMKKEFGSKFKLGRWSERVGMIFAIFIIQEKKPVDEGAGV
jgi:hypothetical protein